MKSTFFYSTLSAIIAGVAIAAASFFFFQNSAEDPLSRVKIEYRKLTPSRTLFTEAVRRINDGAEAASSKTETNFFNAFSYASSSGLLSYRIKNSSAQIIDQMTVHLGDHYYGYAADEDGEKLIATNDKTVNLKILPDKEAEVFLVVNFPSYKPEERFTVGGKVIDVTDMDISSASEPPLIELYREYPFSFFILALLGLSIIPFLLIALIISLTQQNNPKSIAERRSVSELSTSLALITWLRDDDLERYKAVLSKAEATYAQWQAKPSYTPS